ncbi:MAG TPA: DUF423 domain-containing protein [Allosphingosinicella sp.]
MNEANTRGQGDRFCIAAGAGLLALAILLGAFAAHALKARLTPIELGWWQTAVQYQLANAIGVLALASLGTGRMAPRLIVAGSVLFSGSLYFMALTGLNAAGLVTPLGGLLMIVGWSLIAWSAVRRG